MNHAIELSGLDGRNPMAYFAAIGTLIAASRVRPELEPKLSWSQGLFPRPILHVNLDADELISILDDDRQAWKNAAALRGTANSPDDVKLDAADQRDYLLSCRRADDGGRSALLGPALVAEGSFAHNGDGKPTDLHFAAGNQKFLKIARELQSKVTTSDLREALWGPWTYSKKLSTFTWDMTDDRVHALSAVAPGPNKKDTIPGADWLALMGLAAFPVIRGDGRSFPPGSSGTWSKGLFRWGLWSEPLVSSAVRALIASAWPVTQLTQLRVGVFQVMFSKIRRSDQSAGSFSPSSVEWTAPSNEIEGS